MQHSNDAVMLRALLAGMAAVDEADDRPIKSITLDSRQAAQQSLFVALPGGQTDGREFVGAAAEAGAAAIVYESKNLYECFRRPPQVPCYAVANLRGQLGMLAKRFYGDASAQLTVVGVTGTNGKTTTVWTLASALNHLGVSCTTLGTLGFGKPGAISAPMLTTPDVFTLHALAACANRSRSKVFALELSSHGLDQGRADALDVDVAVFTNLSHEHLDYHGDMQRYGEAKARLFALSSVDVAVINADDALCATLRERSSGKRIIEYGYQAGDVRCVDLSCAQDGLALTLESPIGRLSIRSPQIGRFNAANIMAVVSVMIALADECDLSKDDIERGVAASESAPGRMQVVRIGQGPTVVVDFAHTPDALDQALQAVRQHASGNVWCIFGCGGERDVQKRPLMGQLAEQLADRVVLTNDNPRGESPSAIVAAIRAGMSAPAEVILDRQQAIAAVVGKAAEDDWVLLAGKGHESEQVIGAEKLAFSDCDAALAALRDASR